MFIEKKNKTFINLFFFKIEEFPVYKSRMGFFSDVHKLDSLVLWNFIPRCLTSLLFLKNLNLKEKKMTGAISFISASHYL